MIGVNEEEIIENKDTSNGYIVNLFQYARRYRYNYKDLLKYFNYVIESKLSSSEKKINKSYLSFGDFDCIEVIKVNNFKRYSDISEKAKHWLGKRQSIFLYDISESCYEKSTLRYNGQKCIWEDTSERKIGENGFLCITVLSLSNEIKNLFTEEITLINILHDKIISLVNKLSKHSKIICDVFGTFNASEMAIVWLADQYVDILQAVDYIKHIQIKFQNSLSEQAFFTSFSTFVSNYTYEKDIVSPNHPSYNDLKGSALIQISIHDVIKSFGNLKNFIEQITENISAENVMHSVGEYDAIIKVPAKDVISLLKPSKLLSIGEREDGNATYKIKEREILRSNVRLLYEYDENDLYQQKLHSMYENEEFICNYDKKNDIRNNDFYYIEKELDENDTDSNWSLYKKIRDSFQEINYSSAGIIDVIDLLYTDYMSAVSSAYNKLWATDLHKQFKAILYAVKELVTAAEEAKDKEAKDKEAKEKEAKEKEAKEKEAVQAKNSLEKEKLEWSWEDFRELTNVFKQQIYHLMQSNRMFFETPSCHLRYTGHFDYIMHSYYGVTKAILNIIYLIQNKSNQSELVPFITVNAIPQVKTQLFFEHELDTQRVLNLEIPHSIIFVPYRTIHYIAHELFHYMAPPDRNERNKIMTKLYLAIIFKKQFEKVFDHLLSTPISSYINAGYEKDNLTQILMKNIEENENKAKEYQQMLFYNTFYSDENKTIFIEDINEYIEAKYNAIIKNINHSQNTEKLCSSHKKFIISYTQSSLSNEDFKEFFKCILKKINNRFIKHYEKNYLKRYEENEKNDGNNSFSIGEIEFIRAKLKYFIFNESYTDNFIDRHQNFRCSDLYLRSSSKNLNTADFMLGYIWEAIREASCDIAMITSLGMSQVDYMIFSIKAWCDVFKDKKGDKFLPTNKDGLRSAIVMEYFASRITPYHGWYSYSIEKDEDNYTKILMDNDENIFIKKYIYNFYSSHDAQKNADDNQTDKKNTYDELKNDAVLWLNKFKENKISFEKDYLIYNKFINPILKDFDIENRINNLNSTEISPYLEEIKDNIMSCLRDYSKNNLNIFFNMDGSALKNSLDDIIKKERENSFKQDLKLIQNFQKQKTLYELSAINNERRQNNT